MRRGVGQESEDVALVEAGLLFHVGLSTVQVTCGAGGRRPPSLAAGGVLIIAIFHARFDHGRLIYHLS
jgi:hypothetical protein